MSSASPLAASSQAPSAPSATAELRRATASPGPSADRLDGYGEQSFSFSDFLSIINPLQHIPVVGTIYRAITGDTIKPAQKVIGGLLFGGPMGLLSSAFNAIIEETTGKDIGDQVLAAVAPGRTAPAAEPDPQSVAAAPIVSPPTRTTTTTDLAPLSRSLLGANEVPLDPAVALTASDRAAAPVAGRGRTLANGSRGNASTTGRTLADYRASAGRPLPVIDGNRTASNSATPTRLQTTAPLNDRARASITPLPRETAPADREANGARDDAAAGEATEPFVAAMMRGLDRYREMKQIKSAPTVIDASL